MSHVLLCFILTVLTTSISCCSDELDVELLRNNTLVPSSLVRHDVEKLIVSLAEAISTIISQVKPLAGGQVYSEPVSWISAISLLLILVIKIYSIVRKWWEKHQNGSSAGGGGLNHLPDS